MRVFIRDYTSREGKQRSVQLHYRPPRLIINALTPQLCVAFSAKISLLHYRPHKLIINLLHLLGRRNAVFHAMLSRKSSGPAAPSQQHEGLVQSLGVSGQRLMALGQPQAFNRFWVASGEALRMLAPVGSTTFMGKFSQKEQGLLLGGNQRGSRDND